MSGVTFTWSTNLGIMNGSVLNTRTIAGATGYVRATSGVVSDDLLITIVPEAIDHIEVTPTVVTSTVVGTQQQFVAAGKDIYNNSISGLTFNWTTNIGTITSGGMFKAQNVSGDSGYIDARAGGKTGTVNTTIVPDQLTHILVTPNNVNISAGESTNVSAIGYDQYNNPISGLNFTWTTNIGKIDGHTFTAQDTAGVTGYVSASSGLVTGYNVVNILAPDNTWIMILIVVIAIVGGGLGYFLWRRRG